MAVTIYKERLTSGNYAFSRALTASGYQMTVNLQRKDYTGSLFHCNTLCAPKCIKQPGIELKTLRRCKGIRVAEAGTIQRQFQQLRVTMSHEYVVLPQCDSRTTNDGALYSTCLPLESPTPIVVTGAAYLPFAIACAKLHVPSWVPGLHFYDRTKQSHLTLFPFPSSG